MPARENAVGFLLSAFPWYLWLDVTWIAKSQHLGNFMRNVLAWFIYALVFATSTQAGPVGDAAKKGEAAEIQRLLASGADANEEDAIASPLHWAAMNGHVAAVNLLVENGGNLDAMSEMLGAPLHAAARFDRVDTIDALLAADADPDIRDSSDFTPLMRAVVEKRLGAVEALLSGGANVNAIGNVPEARYGRGPKGPTVALHLALSLGESEIAEVLRDAGAEPVLPEALDQIPNNADPVRGLELVQYHCGGGCHMIDANDLSRSAEDYNGPPLTSIVGRPVADVSDYEYSKALLSFGGNWTAERLYAFALTPMLVAPGTRMDWAPDQSPEMVADIVAYFVSLSE